MTAPNDLGHPSRRSCKICSRGLKARQKVDALLASGASLRAISDETNASASTVKRHRDGCASSLRDLTAPIAPGVALDVDELISVARRMMTLAAEIAQAEKTERPGVAVRAAATAARIATDTLGLIVGNDKLIELEAKVAVLAGDAELAEKLRADLLYPQNWKPPRLAKADASSALPEGIMGIDAHGNEFPFPSWGRPPADAKPKVLAPTPAWNTPQRES